jgi:hypothetical protein
VAAFQALVGDGLERRHQRLYVAFKSALKSAVKSAVKSAFISSLMNATI